MEVNEYVQLFEEVKARVGSDDVALAVLQEIGKDGRVERMEGRNGSWNGNGVSNGDSPATSKQIGYLKKLGVPLNAGLTKKQASELIDQHAQSA